MLTRPLLVSLSFLILIFLGLVWMSFNIPTEDAFVPIYNAITLDFILTVPLIYFLIIRKSKIPSITVLPVWIIGLIMSKIIIPAEGQQVTDIALNWILPVIELTVLGVVVWKVVEARKRFVQSEGVDFFERLICVTKEMLPGRLAYFLGTEIAVFYYAFLNWKKPEKNNRAFSYHRKSGTPALLWVFIFLILIESFAIHILVMKWNLIVAWVLTGISIYTVFQVLGLLRSLSKRPILFTDEELKLRYGIFGDSVIRYDNIISVELTRKNLKNEELHKTICIEGP